MEGHYSCGHDQGGAAEDGEPGRSGRAGAAGGGELSALALAFLVTEAVLLNLIRKKSETKTGTGVV